ncbi:MAG: aldo/keto reductase, partial [Opitutales bacterium]|nr:aldo/keto reductase [Opitutales bacterium]
MENKFKRRTFIKGISATAASAALFGCSDNSNTENYGEMTMRENPKTKEKVSLLGFGCMRWPSIDGKTAREAGGIIDQNAVNELVDYAIAHGVNYFDTSPVYCRGESEKATGIALSRHPRNKYFIATKLSNFAKATHPREESIKMYENSFKNLRVDYIDY